MIPAREFKLQQGGLWTAVTPCNQTNPAHRSLLEGILLNIIQHEAKVHGAQFDATGFRNVMQAMLRGDVEILFLAAAWDLTKPKIVGATINFRSLFLQRKGQNIVEDDGIYSEDVCILPSKIRELVSEWPTGFEFPKEGLGAHFIRECVRYFAEKGMRGGIKPAGQRFEFLPNNTKIVKIQEQLGAVLGDQSDFSLTTSWVNAGGVREHNVARQGAFVTQQGVHYRIPSPLYEIVKASEFLTASNLNDAENRYQALNILQELLPKNEDKIDLMIKPDRYLDSIRIMHASAFSLQIPTAGDDFRFNPVLFSRKAIGRAQENDRFLDEAENLLTPRLQSVFANDRFTRWGDVRNCYAIDDGVYVYIDPDLKKALTVVRRIQQSDAAERKKFIRSPHRAIKEFFQDDPNVEALDRLFVETEQYAQNVIGLGIWQPPVIPWVVRQPNSWLPEKFGLKIGDTYVQIKPEDVAGVREDFTKIITTPGFSEQEQAPYNYEGIAIPITQEALDGLEKISSIIAPKINNSPVRQQQQDDEIIKLMPHFLLVEDNLENVNFQVRPQRRSPTPNQTLPVVLKSTLKIHQSQGLKWLVNSWTEGAPGVLLADDMGLGKTLQALTFLAWLKERKQEGHARCKEPVLIVAPTALLNNWQREINIHLREPYLGEICKAYGGSLSVVRTADQNDLTTGQINLSRDHIRRFDVVLTTYETYRDYHHSFGGIKFSAAVLDECQKIKNPKSQVNRALASMNAEFVIAMTGTPVENAMEDLWTILDRTWPGFLGDLKSFSSKYPPDNQESLSKLTRLLKGAAATDVSSPIMLRRMKEDILDDLPKKIIHPDPIIANEVGSLLQSDMATYMPPEQANA